jgi:hypothetical protein
MPPAGLRTKVKQPRKMSCLVPSGPSSLAQHAMMVCGWVQGSHSIQQCCQQERKDRLDKMLQVSLTLGLMVATLQVWRWVERTRQQRPEKVRRRRNLVAVAHRMSLAGMAVAHRTETALLAEHVLRLWVAVASSGQLPPSPAVAAHALRVSAGHELGCGVRPKVGVQSGQAVGRKTTAAPYP